MCIECEDCVYDNVTCLLAQTYYNIPSKATPNSKDIIHGKRAKIPFQKLWHSLNILPQWLLAVDISTIVNDQKCRSIYYGILSKDVAKRLLAVNISTMINEQKYRSKNQGIPSKDVAKRLLAGNISTMVTEQNCESNYWYSLKRRCKRLLALGTSTMVNGRRWALNPRRPQEWCHGSLRSWNSLPRVRLKVRNHV